EWRSRIGVRSSAIARGKMFRRSPSPRGRPDGDHLTQTLQHARHSCEPLATSSYGAGDAETTPRGFSLLRRRGQGEGDVTDGSPRPDDETGKGQGTPEPWPASEAFPVAVALRPLPRRRREK